MPLRGKMPPPPASVLQPSAPLWGGGGQSSQGLSVDGWGEAAKRDHRNGACAFKTRLLLVLLRGALGAPSPDGRCTSATFQSTTRSCCDTRGNKGKKNQNKAKTNYCYLSPRFDRFPRGATVSPVRHGFRAGMPFPSSGTGVAIRSCRPSILT